MTHKYEIVYIFDSALDEAQVNAGLERHHALLKTSDNPDPIDSVKHWGTRTLAYSIKNRETGYYVVTNLKAEPPTLPEFERSIKLDENIIRYLLVLNEGEVPTVPTPREDDEDDGRRRPAREAPSREPAGVAASQPAVAASPPAESEAKPSEPEAAATDSKEETT